MSPWEVICWAGAVLAVFTVLAIVTLGSWLFAEMVTDARRERWAKDAAALDEATAAQMSGGAA